MNETQNKLSDDLQLIPPKQCVIATAGAYENRDTHQRVVYFLRTVVRDRNNGVVISCNNLMSKIGILIPSTRERVDIHIHSIFSAFNFENRTAGIEIDEIICTEAANRMIVEDDDLKIIIATRLRSSGKGSVVFRILQGLGLFLQLPYNKGNSWVKDFNFPPSLYRWGMENYFEDPCNPTREEFLLATTSEGIHATTEEEKQAIKEAEIYISRHSLLPNKD